MKYNNKKNKKNKKVNYLQVNVIYKEQIRKKLKNEYNVELITKSKKNIKNKQYNALSEEDKILLKKRNIIEIGKLRD